MRLAAKANWNSSTTGNMGIDKHPRPILTPDSTESVIPGVARQMIEVVHNLSGSNLTLTLSNQTMVFDEVTHDTGPDNSSYASNQITIAKAGKYSLEYALLCGSPSATPFPFRVIAFMEKDTAFVHNSLTITEVGHDDGLGQNKTMVYNSVTLDLEVGDVLRIRLRKSGTPVVDTDGDNGSMFRITKVG